jgi:hypothetical protein
MRVANVAKRLVLISIICAVLLIGAAGVAILLIPRVPPRILYRGYIASVCASVERIESYRRTHGVYPDPRDFDVPTRIFYDLQTPTHYIVGFAIGFDEQYYWDSLGKRWSFDKQYAVGTSASECHG